MMHEPAVNPLVHKEVKFFSLPAGIEQFKQDNIFWANYHLELLLRWLMHKLSLDRSTAIQLIFNCSTETWYNRTLPASHFGRELFALEPGLHRVALSATIRCFVAWDVLMVIEEALSKWKIGREAIRCLHSICLPMLTATTMDH